MTLHSSRGLRLVAIILATVMLAYGVIAVFPAPKNYKGDNPLMKSGRLP